MVLTGAPEARWTELSDLSFIEKHENAVLPGPGRAGGTRLAYPAAMAGIKIRFATAAGLMLQPAAHNRGKLKSYLQRSVMEPRLPVMDETGCLPFGREEAGLFFNVAAKRYRRGSMIQTADLPFSRRAGLLP